MPRGVLISVDKILLSDGTKVQTFMDCDEGYLEMKEVEIGDVVSFSYVGGGSQHAAEIEKVTPTAKERELQRTAKLGDATETAPKTVDKRTANDLGQLLQAHGVIAKATPAQLAKAGVDIDDADAEDAAFRLLINLPAGARPAFLLCDHHVERSVVTDLDRALAGELSLRVDSEAPAKLELTLIAADKPAGTHTYDDSLMLLQWVQRELVARACKRRLYFLPCYEGQAAVIITEAQCEALRENNIPIEDEAPIY